MAWAMLPGLMNLTRMTASGGMGIGYQQLTANSRVRCPGIKKSGPCDATADFTDGPARDRSLSCTLHAFPQTKMQAGHPVLVTGFTARLPARPAAGAPLPSHLPTPETLWAPVTLSQPLTWSLALGQGRTSSAFGCTGASGVPELGHPS